MCQASLAPHEMKHRPCRPHPAFPQLEKRPHRCGPASPSTRTDTRARLPQGRKLCEGPELPPVPGGGEAQPPCWSCSQPSSISAKPVPGIPISSPCLASSAQDKGKLLLGSGERGSASPLGQLQAASRLAVSAALTQEREAPQWSHVRGPAPTGGGGEGAEIRLPGLPPRRLRGQTSPAEPGPETSAGVCGWVAEVHLTPDR